MPNWGLFDETVRLCAVRRHTETDSCCWPKHVKIVNFFLIEIDTSHAHLPPIPPRRAHREQTSVDPKLLIEASTETEPQRTESWFKRFRQVPSVNFSEISCFIDYDLVHKKIQKCTVWRDQHVQLLSLFAIRKGNRSNDLMS